MTDSLIIDLGCGPNKVPGAVGVDNADLPGIDVVHDLLNFPYPFADQSAAEVHLNHVLEHFILSDINRILAEVARILKPDGVVYVKLPHSFSIAAWADPTHKSFFTFGSGRFFDATSPKAYYQEIDSRWRIEIRCSHVTALDWKQRHMRRVDTLIGRVMRAWINWLLKYPQYIPASADLLVKSAPLFFVEIYWQMRKADENGE